MDIIDIIDIIIIINLNLFSQKTFVRVCVKIYIKNIIKDESSNVETCL